MGLLSADRFDDLGDHIILVELRHDVDASRPSLELLHQFDHDLHPGFDFVVARGFDAFAGFFGDGYAWYFVV